MTTINQMMQTICRANLRKWTCKWKAICARPKSTMTRTIYLRWTISIWLKPIWSSVCCVQTFCSASSELALYLSWLYYLLIHLLHNYFSYIFTSMNLENSTKLSCIKMMIRLARTSKAVAEKIVGHKYLLQNIFDQFSSIPQTTDSKCMLFDVWSNVNFVSLDSHFTVATIRMLSATKVVSLKLFRVICAYDGGVFIDRLRNIGLDTIVKNCVFVQENGITVEKVKLQIEAMRCTKIITVNTKSDSLFEYDIFYLNLNNFPFCLNSYWTFHFPWTKYYHYYWGSHCTRLHIMTGHIMAITNPIV